MAKGAEAEWVAIEDLTPWSKNPRRNDHAVADVAESIRRFGWSNPIIARRSDRVIVAGHTRFKAAKKLGLDKVLVRYMDLDPAQAKALALADNRLGELAEWDQDALGEILRELKAEDVILEGLGWDNDRIADLIGDFDDLPSFDSDDEAGAPVAAPPPPSAVTPDEPSSTAQPEEMHTVEIHLTKDEIVRFRAAVRELAAKWGHDNPSSVILRAVEMLGGPDVSSA